MNLVELTRDVRIPNQHDKVHNEECIFSFDNPVRLNNCMHTYYYILYIVLFVPLSLTLLSSSPFQDSPSGLFVCMEKFVGLGEDHVEQYHRRTGNSVFLNIRRKKVPLKEEERKEEIPEKVSKMAIGVPGGFEIAKKRYEHEYSYQVAILPGFKYLPVGERCSPACCCSLLHDRIFLTQIAPTFPSQPR